MTADTVYDIFLALPETERQRHIALVNKHKKKEDTKYCNLSKNKKKVLIYTEQDAMNYLLKNIFSSKKIV